MWRFWFINNHFSNWYLILLVSKLFQSKCEKLIFSRVHLIRDIRDKTDTETLYILSIGRVDLWTAQQTPRRQPKKFEWYTACFMSTLSHDKSTTLGTNGTYIFIYGSCVWSRSITTRSQSHTHYYRVRLCTTWHFLNMGQNFTPNFNLFDVEAVAVAALHTRRTTDWLVGCQCSK